MCECKEVVISVPPEIDLRYNAPGHKKRETVCIDKCLVEEIKCLWSMGVRTEGCCCGHSNDRMASVLVHGGDADKMLNLGYKVWKNPMDPSRKDGFVPKSIGQ